MDEAILNRIRKIDGWLFDEEAELLYNYGKKAFMFDHILELGAYKGKSTLALAVETDATVHSVDTFMSNNTTVQEADTFEEWSKNTQGLPCISYKMTTDEYFSTVQEQRQPSYGLIFVDADHSYEQCKKDCDNALKYLRRGGYLIMHDAFGENGEEGPWTPWPGVTQVWRELCNNPELKYVEKCRRCAVFRKVK